MYQTQPKYKQKNTLFIVSSSTGKERDSETGFSYFGARYYDSDLMTGWLSVDPMADKYPNLSPYAYCAWNPIKLVDPDGEEIYMLFYVTGNKRGDGMFKAAAETRKKEIESKYAERITSRLFGEYYPLVFTGVDVSKQKMMK